MHRLAVRNAPGQRAVHPAAPAGRSTPTTCRSGPGRRTAGARSWVPTSWEPTTVLPELAATVDVTIVVGYHYAHSLAPPPPRRRRTGRRCSCPPLTRRARSTSGWVRQMFDDADLVLCLAPEEAELVDRTYQCGARTVVVPCPVDDLVRPDRADGRVGRRDVRPGARSLRDGGRAARPRQGERRRDPLHRRVPPCRRPDVHARRRRARQGQRPRRRVWSPPGSSTRPRRTRSVAGSQVVVQPSYMESFSLSLMEGWLLERPALVQQRSAVLAGHVDALRRRRRLRRLPGLRGGADHRADPSRDRRAARPLRPHVRATRVRLVGRGAGVRRRRRAGRRGGPSTPRTREDPNMTQHDRRTRDPSPSGRDGPRSDR